MAFKLAIIGLGKIGSLIAEAAIGLGMNVLGYDPEITVDAAWSLPAQVRKAHSIEEVLKASDFITLHVPLVNATRNLVNAERMHLLRKGAMLLNFSRDGIVDAEAVLEVLAAGKLRAYVCDFPHESFRGQPGVLALPHAASATLEVPGRKAPQGCTAVLVQRNDTTWAIGQANGLTLDQQRAVVTEVIAVIMHPGGGGKRTFDPTKVTYRQLVDYFFRMHNPTQVNRQGPDIGDQYRSVIFTHSAEQRKVAEEVKAALEAARKFPLPIATKIEGEQGKDDADEGKPHPGRLAEPKFEQEGRLHGVPSWPVSDVGSVRHRERTGCARQRGPDRGCCAVK